MQEGPEREPSAVAQVATRQIRFICWFFVVLIALAAVGAVVRNASEGGGESGYATPLPQMEVSETTMQCLNERTDGQYEAVVRSMWGGAANPSDEDIVASLLLYGCLSDAEAVRLYGADHPGYPPSAQRCVEILLGVEGMEGELRRIVEEPDYMGHDAWGHCLSG